MFKNKIYNLYTVSRNVDATTNTRICTELPVVFSMKNEESLLQIKYCMFYIMQFYVSAVHRTYGMWKRSYTSLMMAVICSSVVSILPTLL